MKTTKKNGASNAPTTNAADGLASLNTESETQMSAFDRSPDEQADLFDSPESSVPQPSTRSTSEFSGNPLPEISRHLSM